MSLLAKYTFSILIKPRTLSAWLLTVATDDFGDLSRSSVLNLYSAYPFAYLLSSVKVLSGTGTSSDSFILEN